MVMDLSGLIKGLKVDGIIGYDLFRRCVVEVDAHSDKAKPQSRGVPRSITASSPTSHLSIKSPCEAMDEQKNVVWSWAELTLISCLPHVKASFRDASGREHQLLLLLDTGASGAGVFIHSRAVEEQGMDMNFPSIDDSSASHQMKGVGGSSGFGVDLVEIPSVTVGGLTRNKVKCVVTKTSSGCSGIDLSLYSHGIMGADFLHGLSYCIDLSRDRLGLLLI